MNVEAIRGDFPFFKESDLIYLDNSATSQRPQAVLDAVSDYYFYNNANPFRGLYELSIRATDKYEEAREAVRRFINAKSSKEIIFTRNASECLNLLAYSLGELCINEGDEIIISILEHHSNMLPWRLLAKRKGATIKYLDCENDGTLSKEKLQSLLSEKTKIVALSGMSNVFGSAIDAKAFAEVIHSVGAYFVCDGAQSVPHMKTDVIDSGVDFLAFSGHKMMSEMGIGVLYGKEDLLEKMPPFLSGGEMIEYVSRDDITYAPLPHKFEAGTVNAGGAISLKAAIEYIEKIGFDEIEERENELSKYAYEGIKNIPHLHLLGSDDPYNHHGIFTFKIDNVHPHDIAAICADENVAVRAGHHCAEPLHQFIEIPSTTRASLMFYNTKEEIDKLIKTLSSIRSLMGFTD